MQLLKMQFYSQPLLPLCHSCSPMKTSFSFLVSIIQRHVPFNCIPIPLAKKEEPNLQKKKPTPKQPVTLNVCLFYTSQRLTVFISSYCFQNAHYSDSCGPLRSKKSVQKNKKWCTELNLEELAGKPRCSPMEKNNDQWGEKNSLLLYVNSILCVLYKNMVRFYCCLSSCMREFTNTLLQCPFSSGFGQSRSTVHLCIVLTSSKAKPLLYLVAIDLSLRRLC